MRGNMDPWGWMAEMDQDTQHGINAHIDLRNAHIDLRKRFRLPNRSAMNDLCGTTGHGKRRNSESTVLLAL